METLKKVDADRRDSRLPRRVLHFKALPAMAMLLFILWWPGTMRADSVEREYAVKAGFLFHLVQFIEWPPETMPEPGEPFCIGVLGKDPFGGFLDELVKGETFNDRPLEVKLLESVDEARDCQVVFIANDDNDLRQEALKRLTDLPVLLVGEDDDFVRDGGMVSLVLEGNRVAVVVNTEALAAAGLIARSRLLRVARIVEEG